MKKVLIAFVLIAGFSFTSQAQDIAPNALGLRLGDSDGFGAEISYQRALGGNNRLELDLGIRDGKNYDGFKLAGLYQWVWNIDGGFNWYAGVGGGLASYGYDDNRYDDDTFVFAAGDIVRGASLVVWAIRDGRDAAEQIKTFLQNKIKKEKKDKAA